MTSAYFSYHFANDAHRAAAVRRASGLEADEPISAPAWEELGWGGDTAVTRWVTERMRGKDCLVVLIGAQTSLRKWVKWEIKQAWDSGRGVIGINIHDLTDQKGKTAKPGANPFAAFGFGDSKLSDHIRVHEPLGETQEERLAHIAANAHIWAANAVAARRQPAA